MHLQREQVQVNACGRQALEFALVVRHTDSDELAQLIYPVVVLYLDRLHSSKLLRWTTSALSELLCGVGPVEATVGKTIDLARTEY